MTKSNEMTNGLAVLIICHDFIVHFILKIQVNLLEVYHLCDHLQKEWTFFVNYGFVNTRIPAKARPHDRNVEGNA